MNLVQDLINILIMIYHIVFIVMLDGHLSRFKFNCFRCKKIMSLNCLMLRLIAIIKILN